MLARLTGAVKELRQVGWRPAGLEPASSASSEPHSIQLSYGRCRSFTQRDCIDKGYRGRSRKRRLRELQELCEPAACARDEGLRFAYRSARGRLHDLG